MAGNVQTIQYPYARQLAKHSWPDVIRTDGWPGWSSWHPLLNHPIDPDQFPGVAIQPDWEGEPYTEYTGNNYVLQQQENQTSLMLPIPPFELSIDISTYPYYTQFDYMKIKLNDVSYTNKDLAGVKEQNTAYFYMRSGGWWNMQFFSNLKNIVDGMSPDSGGIRSFDIYFGSCDPCTDPADVMPPFRVDLTLWWGGRRIESEPVYVCNNQGDQFVGTIKLDWNRLRLGLDTTDVDLKRAQEDLSCSCTLCLDESSSEVCSVGFPGFLHPEQCYRYYTFRDWDSCLFGNTPVMEGGFDYAVDGHVDLKWQDAEKAVVICSTGNYVQEYPVGMLVQIDPVTKYPVSLYLDSGQTFSDTKKSADPGSAECSNPLGNKIYALLSNKKPKCPDDSSSSCATMHIKAPYGWCRALVNPPTTICHHPKRFQRFIGLRTVPNAPVAPAVTGYVENDPESLKQGDPVFAFEDVSFSYCTGDNLYLKKCEKAVNKVTDPTLVDSHAIVIDGVTYYFYNSYPCCENSNSASASSDSQSFCHSFLMSRLQLVPGCCDANDPNQPKMWVQCPTRAWNDSVNWDDCSDTGMIAKKVYTGAGPDESQCGGEYDYTKNFKPPDNVLYLSNEIEWPKPWLTDTTSAFGSPAGWVFTLTNYSTCRTVFNDQTCDVEVVDRTNRIPDDYPYTGNSFGYSCSRGYVKRTGRTVGPLLEGWIDPDMGISLTSEHTFYEITDFKNNLTMWVDAWAWENPAQLGQGHTLCSITEPVQESWSDGPNATVYEIGYSYNHYYDTTQRCGRRHENTGEAWIYHGSGIRKMKFIDINGVYYTIGCYNPGRVFASGKGPGFKVFTLSPCVAKPAGIPTRSIAWQTTSNVGPAPYSKGVPDGGFWVDTCGVISPGAPARSVLDETGRILYFGETAEHPGDPDSLHWGYYSPGVHNSNNVASTQRTIPQATSMRQSNMGIQEIEDDFE